MSINLIPEVSIIGSGSVASSLAHAFKSQAIPVNEIYSRSIGQAKRLSTAIEDSSATDSLDFAKSQSNIFIISVSDDAVEELVQKIKLPESALLCHTSGTVSIGVLTSHNGGIFYPLQTFTKDKWVDFKEVPILIEGSNSRSLDILKELGSVISHQVIATTEKQRQQLHVAAVFASNFTNRMLAASEEILENASLDLEILKPLVFESIRNAFESNPDKALTGPAKRGDQSTVNHHLKLLEAYPELRAIYAQISASIPSKSSHQD